MPAQKKYNPSYHDAWAWSLAIKGATDQEIADAFGVSRQTIIRWSKTKNEKGDEVLTSFGEALQTGKEAADAQVEKKLYERCLGYEHDEVKRILKADASGRQSLEKTEVTHKTVPPDTMAIMYWLNNRKRRTGEWSQRQDVNLSLEGGNIREAVRELSLDEARAALADLCKSDDEE